MLTPIPEIPFDLSIESLKQLTAVYVVPLGLRLVSAILLFLIGRLVARGLVKLFNRLCEQRMDESLRRFVGNGLYALSLVVVVIAALDRLGVRTTAAVTILGAAGLAVSLAFKASLANFAAGVMLLVFRPYKIGDMVTAGGHTGVVKIIDAFSTTITTEDNRQVIIPNSQANTGAIINLSAAGTRRIDLVIGASYGSDLRQAKNILADIVAQDERILKAPPARVAVFEFTDSATLFAVRPWVKTADYWEVRFDIIERIEIAFEANGITIAGSQQH